MRVDCADPFCIPETIIIFIIKMWTRPDKALALLSKCPAKQGPQGRTMGEAESVRDTKLLTEDNNSKQIRAAGEDAYLFDPVNRGHRITGSFALERGRATFARCHLSAGWHRSYTRRYCNKVTGLRTMVQ